MIDVGLGSGATTNLDRERERQVVWIGVVPDQPNGVVGQDSTLGRDQVGRCVDAGRQLDAPGVPRSASQDRRLVLRGQVELLRTQDRRDVVVIDDVQGQSVLPRPQRNVDRERVPLPIEGFPIHAIGEDFLPRRKRGRNAEALGLQVLKVHELPENPLESRVREGPTPDLEHGAARLPRDFVSGVEDVLVTEFTPDEGSAHASPPPMARAPTTRAPIPKTARVPDTVGSWSRRVGSQLAGANGSLVFRMFFTRSILAESSGGRT